MIQKQQLNIKNDTTINPYSLPLGLVVFNNEVERLDMIFNDYCLDMYELIANAVNYSDEWWNYISRYVDVTKIPQKFIDILGYKLDWHVISFHQKLSESFIEKYSDLLNWNLISMSQTLSEDFILEHSDLVNWCNIFLFQDLSDEFKQEHSGKVCGKIDLNSIEECYQ